MSKCPVCNEEVKVIVTVRFVELVGLVENFDQEVKACDNCNYVFSSVIPSEIMTRYYKSFESSHYMDHHSQEIVGEDKIKMTNRQLTFIIDKVKDFRSVLDIGALTGFNLNTFKKAGYKVHGVEPSSNNVKFAKNKYNIDLFAGTLEEYYQEKDVQKDDLVILSHVLEHIPNPLDFIEKVSQLNNKYLYIEVPAALDYQFDNEPYGIFYYEHVNFFSLSSLDSIMERVGYQCIRGGVELNADNTAPGEPAIVTLWEKVESNKQRKGIKGVYKSSFLLNEYCRNSDNRFKKIQSIIDSIPQTTRLAVWGAGSHTSRLLGMSNLRNKNIIKFYDNDSQKQKHMLLNKPITPFLQEDLDKNIDNILISTHSGEESIMKYLNSINQLKKAILLYH
jgi:SAM-dependent methyltransferase